MTHAQQQPDSWEQWDAILADEPDDGQAWHQLMTKRQQRVEEAFIRLIAQRATPEDIKFLADELGVLQPH